MGISFSRGQALGREDLKIYLDNAVGIPINPAEIYYALYDVTTGQEALVGPPKRTPANPSVGEFFSDVVIPLDANLGDHRIRWFFRETVAGPLQQAIQEFVVMDKAAEPLVLVGSIAVTDLLRRLRIMLRDNNPDRNYHFRPPTHEDTIRQFNRVFGYIWEDYELVEFLDNGLDMLIASPPHTPFRDVDQLMQMKPEWRTLLLTGAMYWALNALRLNWVADEFSVDGCTQILVSDRAKWYDLTIEDLYHLCSEASEHPVSRAFFSGSLEVRSVRQNGHVCIGTCVKVLRHETGHKKAFRIETSLGQQVVTTCDHSLFSRDGGSLVPVRADELKVGMRLVSYNDWLRSPEIVAIEECAPLEVSYDLSVPGPENFILTNGLLAHNSYSIGGVSLDLDKSSKYESAAQGASEQFDKLLEKAKSTVKFTKGLQQPKYGIGIRSSFGPYLGRGVVSPNKFIGM